MALDRLRIWDGEARAEAAERAMNPWEGSLPIGPADRRHIRDLYDGAVAYGDAFLGSFLDALRERELLDRSVLVVLSDHGESLGEQGLFGHSYSLTDRDVHVPLMIRLPGGQEGGRRVSGPVALLDVMPTILDQLDQLAPAQEPSLP